MGFLREKNITLGVWLIALLLVSVRLFHLRGVIDEPHAWRQMDTAHYIRTFAEKGIDLFHPEVAWMGGHKTLILEFPLPEAIVSLPIRVLGSGTYLIMRLGFLLFFLGAAAYWFQIVRFLVNTRFAQIATLLYLAFPLSIFYSRAIHIDFSEIFFVHGFVYHFLRGFRSESKWHIALSAVWAILAWLVKSPYILCVYPSLALWVFSEKKWRYFLKITPFFLLGPLFFFLWRLWVHHVNAAAPDWYFIPGYTKFINQRAWYFGTWAQRTDPESWQVFWDRIQHSLFAPWAFLVALAGLLALAKIPARGIWYVWFLGTLSYLAIFFNLNLNHDYYQIPFLAPFSVLVAAPFFWVGFRQEGPTHSPLRAGIAWGLLLLFLGWQVVYTETSGRFYQKDALIWDTGNLIQQNTQPDNLVVASYGGLDCRAPHLLFAAHRCGWQIPEMFLSTKLLKKLQSQGATHFAWIRDSWIGDTSSLMPDRHSFTFPLPQKKRLHLWNLDFPLDNQASHDRIQSQKLVYPHFSIP